MIVVIGIGADGMAGLAPSSADELRSATVIYGSPRQLELLDDAVTAQRREWTSPMLGVLQSIGEHTTGDVHVVASGDPMLHGIGATLIRRFGAESVRVLPHVSSVTLACARLGWSVQDTEVISLVTAPVHTAVRRGGQAVVLSRDGSSPAALARLLSDTGRGDSEFAVLEQLGGPRERVRRSTAAAWNGEVQDLNVVAVRYRPDDRRHHALPDEAFAHDGQITKQTIRAVTLAALGPRPGERLWDVGSGSGSIAVEWCRSGPGLVAVAFERDEQRRGRIAANAAAFGARVDVRGAAPDAFADAEPAVGGVTGVPSPAAIFIGGGLTTPGLLEACFERLAPGGRLVANAVTAESEAVVIQWYSKLGGQLRRFQHYRGEPIGGFTGFRPAYPVTQWVVRAVTVYFIGAGPGAADLITVRGQRLLNRCQVCLYAGSIMPEDLLAECPDGARVIDTGPLNLEQIIDELSAADAAGLDVARLHSGDPSIYSALAEQCRRLDARNIAWEIVPGVPSFAAAAAAVGRELTVPGVSQTVTLSRVATLSTAMPERETLAALSAPGNTLVLHLAAAQIDSIVEQLTAGGYTAETPCAVVAFASWPKEQVLRSSLGQIAAQMHSAGITRTAVIIVGDVLAAEGFTDSYLYSSGRRRGSRH